MRGESDSFIIKLNSIKLFGHHGILPHEKEKGQDFFIDVRLKYEKTDDLDTIETAIDYAQIDKIVSEVFESKRYNLLESLVKDIADTIHKSFPQVRKLKVKVTKTGPPNGLHASSVSVSTKLL